MSIEHGAYLCFYVALLRAYERGGFFDWLAFGRFAVDFLTGLFGASAGYVIVPPLTFAKDVRA